MSRNSSIEKLNNQIDMLTNRDFVDKKNSTRKVERTKPRKEILEEVTIIEDEDLMSDLIGDDESTKVFGQKEETQDTTKEVENFEDIDDNKSDDPVIYHTKEIKKDEFKDLDKYNEKVNKFYDVILPIILIILIFIFITLTIII